MKEGLDEYGTVTNDDSGARIIAHVLKTGSVVFNWSPNAIDSYIFLIVPDFRVYGVMPFGGNPRSRVYVGLYGKGCNHFSLSLDTDTHPGYWMEKLGIDQYGAAAWAEFWNKIKENYA